MRLYEAIADRLTAVGVDTVFAVMGDGNLHLLAELGQRDGVRIVHARHEQGAVAMADGYARTTGRLGVATVTHGPGLTNTATALATAAAHGTPLLLIAGALAGDDVHNLQRLAQAPFATVLGARSVALTRRGVADVDDAIRWAMHGQTVVLQAPTDLQRAPLDGPVPLMSAVPVWAAAPDPASVRLAADALRAAERPVLLAGRGASSDAAIAAVTELALAAGCRVVTTLLAKGNFAGTGVAAGVAGGLGDASASAVLADADVVVAIGASLNEWTTSRGRFSDGARILQVDRDRGAFGRFQHVEAGIHADAARFAEAVTAELAVGAHDVPASSAALAGAGHADPASGGHADPEPAAGIGLDPAAACAMLDRVLPEDRIIVVDGGHLCMWATQLLAVHRPRSFTHGFSFGSIAQSLALAMGAAAGAQGRRAVAVMGDGAAAMSIAELETAARCRLPLTVVVLSDGGFGIERHSLRFEGLPESEADYPAPSFAALAAAWGVRSTRIETDEDWVGVRELSAGDGPALIEVVVDGEPVNPTFREIKTLIR